MHVIRQLDPQNPESRRVCAAIGVFDGVHLGHQQVIRKAMAEAQQFGAVCAVITFDRHPSAVVAPDRVPPMLYTQTQKLEVLASLGVDITLLIPFDAAFSQLSGEAFTRSLCGTFRYLRSLCVGGDFAFGHRRSGNVGLLERLGKELGFEVHGLAAVSLDGEVVSSTRIRNTIMSGRFDLAEQMLGRPWALRGTVVQGDQVGRTLGFPTANLSFAGLVTPPHGVYLAHLNLRGTMHHAVVNVGIRPTVATGKPELRIEAHLLDFSGNLYGAEVDLVFRQKLREEQRFGSLELLKEQIARDIQAARDCLAR